VHSWVTWIRTREFFFKQSTYSDPHGFYYLLDSDPRVRYLRSLGYSQVFCADPNQVESGHYPRVPAGTRSGTCGYSSLSTPEDHHGLNLALSSPTSIDMAACKHEVMCLSMNESIDLIDDGIVERVS
jgi:hypothetical protein